MSRKDSLNQMLWTGNNDNRGVLKLDLLPSEKKISEFQQSERWILESSTLFGASMPWGRSDELS